MKVKVICNCCDYRRAARFAPRASIATRPSRTTVYAQIPSKAQCRAQPGTTAQTAPNTPTNLAAQMVPSATEHSWRLRANARLAQPECTALRGVSQRHLVTVTVVTTAPWARWCPCPLMVLVATSVHRAPTARKVRARVFCVPRDPSIPTKVRILWSWIREDVYHRCSVKIIWHFQNHS